MSWKSFNFWLIFIRNLLRIVILILIILYFLGFRSLKEVFAVSNIGWANDFNIDVSAGYAYKNSNGLSSGPLAFNNVPNSTEPYADVHSYLSTNANFYNGFLFGITDTFNKNYVYSVTFFSCTTNFYLPDLAYDMLIGEYDQVFDMKATPNPFRRTHARMNKQPFSWQTTDYNSCAKFNYLFTAQKNAPWIGIYFRNKSVNKNVYFDVYRVDIDIVGYDGNEIVNSLVGSNETLKQDIIDNQDKNTQDTIDNDNKNHQEIMDDSNIKVNTEEVDQITGLFPAGPVDSLLNIPFTVTSKIVNSLSGSCTPITVPTLNGQTLEFSCLGDTLYSGSFFNTYIMNFIGLVPAALMLISYFKRLYKKVDRATSMNANADDEWGVI